jgi:branched-chain amino acid aminotransferase
MTPDKFLPYTFKEGKFVKFEEATVNFANYSLQYGLSVFGGLRAIPNPDNHSQFLIFRIKDHATRLSQSAKYLMQDYQPDYIEEKIIEFVKINKPDTAIYIRPFIYVNKNGIAPKLHGLEFDLGIYGLPLGDYLDPNGVTCTFSSWTKTSDRSIPSRGKVNGGYINSALAKTEAYNRGFDEALMLDSDGNVVEASAMNVFMVKDGKLITPPENADILEGIVRKSVITLAEDLGIEVIQRPISKTELVVASEVFLTGTAARITPVTKIEQYQMPADKPVTTKLRNLMEEINLGKNSQYDDWVTRVEV